nr:hypothetical protein [Klebsiella pneumoniae]
MFHGGASGWCDGWDFGGTAALPLPDSLVAKGCWVRAKYPLTPPVGAVVELTPHRGGVLSDEDEPTDVIPFQPSAGVGGSCCTGWLCSPSALMEGAGYRLAVPAPYGPERMKVLDALAELDLQNGGSFECRAHWSRAAGIRKCAGICSTAGRERASMKSGIRSTGRRFVRAQREGFWWINRESTDRRGLQTVELTGEAVRVL